MEKYTTPEMEVIEFESEDVITTSGLEEYEVTREQAAEDVKALCCSMIDAGIVEA